MPLPKTQTELLKKLHDTANKLDAEFENFADARKPDVEGISPADRLGYQIGWGRCLLTWNTEGQAGRVPEMPARGYRWNQLGELAQVFYDRYRSLSIEELRQQFRSLVEEIVRMIESMTDQELFEVGSQC